MEKRTVYEIGYLLSPLLPEAEALSFVETGIKAKVLAVQGEVLSATGPKLIPLAYSMSKVLDNKKSTFTDAYFGSVKFELAPDDIIGLNREWREAPEIIRHLVIKTAREDITIPPPVVEGEAVALETPKVVEAVIPEEKRAAALDEVIDREIAGMLTV